MQIITENYYLRPLLLDDVSERYLKWLIDKKTSKYIVSAGANHTIGQLKQNVQPWIENENVIFLGIFDRISDLHIGNIKFDPINKEYHNAVLGILIGENSYRGKGVAREVIHACASWLHQYEGIHKLILGVDKSHNIARKAYEKIGFKVFEDEDYPPSKYTIHMVYNINNS